MEISSIIENVAKIRASRPLILNLTNYVAANTNANALLALGASPAMSHWSEDVRELAAFAQALVVNIGTPTPDFVDGIFAAGAIARKKNIPVVLDPIAMGVTRARTDAGFRFIEECGPAVIRGNASEIMATAGVAATSRGADSTAAVEEALESAQRLAMEKKCVVTISGESDYITDGRQTCRITGGHSMMPLVTALGCTATALTGAFLAVADPFSAAVGAMVVMSAAGSRAGEKAQGPGTLQLYFYDALYLLGASDLETRVQMEFL
ncbi:MAG: hydroxyethylthiazole kinase [Gammaproteobacteria bacterium]|nr:MAG: hydroxyethylthiazole kinase [Gammaproteobacteria bacterium]